jgi:RNA polymerase sigma factor (TIGR02999 family)
MMDTAAPLFFQDSGIEMTPRDGATLDEGMFRVVYDELRRLAHGLQRGRENPTLNATALVHEAYIKLSQASRFRAESPQHLKWTVVVAMKQILLDAARRQSAAIRGGPNAALRRLPLDDAEAQSAAFDPREIILVDFALGELARQHELAARAFELQFFGGLEIREIAELLAVSEKKVQRLLKLAKARLSQALSAGNHAAGATR